MINAQIAIKHVVLVSFFVNYCMHFFHLVRDDVINVHLVAHSHDDTGYRKTTDDYYYGTKNFVDNFPIPLGFGGIQVRQFDLNLT